MNIITLIGRFENLPQKQNDLKQGKEAMKRKCLQTGGVSVSKELYLQKQG